MGGRDAHAPRSRLRGAARTPIYHASGFPEAALEETEAGLVPVSGGWFVLNARDARWNHRPGRGQWDFVHCPAGTNHVIVGAGDGPCAVLAMSSREHQAAGPWGAYTVNEVALRHGAGVEDETQDADVAYARVPTSEPTRYRDGWLRSK
jgi:hypothetical protein